MNKMKKFKKIAAIFGATLMAGLTFGTASAAMFPAPFVQSGTANVAIVYGTGAGVSSLDQAYAGNIQTTLSEAMPNSGGTVVVTGGEAYPLMKSSDNFNFGDALNSVRSTLTKDELDFLADGTYDDGDIDTDYDQTITLGTKTLSLFADSDYMDKEPTVGFHWSNNDEVLSYTIDFDDDVNYTEMVDTYLPMLGAEYYVLAASASQIDVLDTAETHSLALGETSTIGDYEVYVDFIGSDKVTFVVNGETTDNIAENEEYELQDGSYIVATSIRESTKDSVTDSVEFSIGNGKLELINGQEAKSNGDRIKGLDVTLNDGSTGLSSLTLTWTSDDDTFLTEDNSVSMPGLGVIQLAYGGMTYPADSEEISVDAGETLTLQMDNYDLPIAWYDADNSLAYLGEEDHMLKVAADSYTYLELGFENDTTVWWNGEVLNATAGFEDYRVVAPSAMNVSEDDRFIVTRIDNDLSDVETGYYELTNIDVDGGLSDFTVELQDLIGDDDLTFDAIGDTDEHGDLTFTLAGFSADNMSAIFNVTAGSDTITWNKAVSDMGLVVTIPTTTAADINNTGATLTFAEANKDEDVGLGREFTVTVNNNSNDNIHVSTWNLTAYDEEESNDVYVGYVPSDLASMVTFDKSADEYAFSVEYFGKEATADVEVVAGGDVSVTAGSNALGNIVVKDSEVDSVKSKNLIIVGGSCINSAAASVLGVSERTCGAAFTAATGVGSGQFLIQSVADAYTSGKVALVVAGYDVTDTSNAATYLRTKDVDTTAGKKYIGTSATQATLQVN